MITSSRLWFLRWFGEASFRHFLGIVLEKTKGWLPMELLTNLTLPFIEKDQLLYFKQTDDVIFLIIELRSSSSKCPKCQATSHRRHSRYTRLVKDLANADTPVEIQVITSKWFCENTECNARVFTERIPWLQPYHRRTERLERVIETIGFSTSCLAAEKICRSLHIPVSHDTILRSIKNKSFTPENPEGSPFCRN